MILLYYIIFTQHWSYCNFSRRWFVFRSLH